MLEPRRKKKDILAGFVSGVLIVSGIAVLGYALWTLSSRAPHPLFSARMMLEDLWEAYKKEYVEGTGRTIDKQRGSITTSEGQSYTMLRAVWMDDKDTFDRAWTWTRENLQHSDDHLFAWLWGRQSDGTWGVVTESGGQNAASDADTDIAVALLFAGRRWGDVQYTHSARAIIDDIWTHEVLVIRGKPYLMANNIEKTKKRGTTVVVNPSYLAPYAYRMFADLDPNHEWRGLVDTSYDLLSRAGASPLDTKTSVGLPPDWITLDRATGAIVTVREGGITPDYSFDAMRVPWRIALDWHWYGDPEARIALERLGFLTSEWRTHGALASSYAHDGKTIMDAETPAMYGGNLGFFMVIAPADAQDLYTDKLLPLYDPDINAWRTTLSYYDDNWAWFGLALYHHALPNLAAS